MKKRNHFFAYMSRMRFIQRWALMRNTFAENDAFLCRVKRY